MKIIGYLPPQNGYRRCYSLSGGRSTIATPMFVGIFMSLLANALTSVVLSPVPVTCRPDEDRYLIAIPVAIATLAPSHYHPYYDSRYSCRKSL